jgi:hypothetical protein
MAAVLEEALSSGTTVNDLAINPPLLWAEQLVRLETKRGRLAG